jgi:probable addiction module antidote protein
MATKHIDYEENLFEALIDPKEALAYLNAALTDEDPRIFLLALKDVLTAQKIDITAFAQKSQLTRQNIYRMLSAKGNPRWENLTSLLDALGLQVHLTRKKERKSLADLFTIDKKLRSTLTRQATRQGISLSELINEKLRK